jgi:hypothetical protein
MLQFLRKYHKWPSLVFTLFILIFAVSGIILNHRDLLSPVDVNRKWMPAGYSWKNWNLAAIKGSVEAGPDSMLVYGNVGVWLTDSTFGRFTDFNRGFPEGIDNRKTNTMLKAGDGQLYAGTLFGLYRYDPAAKKWRPELLPVPEKRIVKVITAGDSLLVMTRSNLLWRPLGDLKAGFRIIPVPAAVDDDGKTGLFRTLWVIHSGEIYGFIGKLIVDAVGIFFIIICITGIIWFTVPYLLKRVKEASKSRLRRFNRNSLRWHNWLGSWFLPLLIVTTITGIFLRPPLLIPIASSRVAKIKFSELDSPNPWFDRFRDLQYDREKGMFLVATSEGIYYSADRFGSRLQPFSVLPPVSVMGINVFEVIETGRYRIGSFSGIFDWNPATGQITDCFTGMEFVDTGQRGAPFGNLTVAGYLKTGNGHEYIFDYAAGAIGLKSAPSFVSMPHEVIEQSPISLWNASLEVHTGRIFEPLLGSMYILVVPVTGLFTLFILITGFFSWWLAKRKKEKISVPD